jgi:hypothetical protein
MEPGGRAPPSIRAHAHDMQHLPPFVAAATKRPVAAGQGGALPPLDLGALQGEFDRYDLLFAEVQTQAGVHSAKLAKLLGKLWHGAAATLKDLFALNARLAGEKAEAQQEHSRIKLAAGHAKDAYMTELDQMKLQLTVMRAALRDREAALATEARGSAGLADEIRRLRAVVGTFVEGRAARDAAPGPGGGDFGAQWMQGIGQDRATDLFTLSDDLDQNFALMAREGQRQVRPPPPQA